jgi:peptidyl-prolyl cis-trans isomerase C
LLSEIDNMVKGSGQPVRPEMASKMKVFLYDQALNGLIEKQLLLEIAAEKKIVVEDKDVEEQIAAILKRFGSADKLNQILALQGMTLDSLKARMKEDMIYTKVLDSEVAKSAEVTDEDIKKFFEENKSRMNQPEQVQASHILIKTESSSSAADKTKAKEQLQAIRKDILNKKVTFEDAAKEHSDCPSGKASGGDLGPFSKGQMAAPFEAAAFAAEVGVMSDIVETQFGYHIIKVTDKIAAKEATLDEWKEKIKGRLVNNKLQEVNKAYLEKLREGAKIETMIDKDAWDVRHAEKPAPSAPGAGAIQIAPGDLKP